LKNGLLRVKTRELLPHSHEWLSTIRIPIRFDPDATCPPIDRFIGEIFPCDPTGLGDPRGFADTRSLPTESHLSGWL